MGERRDPIEVYISSFHQTLFEVFDIKRCKEYEYSNNDDKQNEDYEWGQSVKLIIPYLEPHLSNYLTGLESCPKSISEQFRYSEENGSVKDVLSDGMLYGHYPMSYFWKDVQCDLFTWIASELLFRTPENFSKKNMALYQPFEGKSSFIDGIPITTRNWNSFKDNIEYLTPRLKEIPMPPHMFSIFSQNITGIKNKKKKPDPRFKFLIDEDTYSSLDGISLDTFLEFEKNIISSGIDGARKNIMAVNNTPSELLDVLVDSYLERAFGFFLVKFAVMGIIKCNRFHLDKNKQNNFFRQIRDRPELWNATFYYSPKEILSAFLEPIKYVKSMDGLVYARAPLLQKCFYSGIERYDISKGVGCSFDHITRKFLEVFSKNYIDSYGNDPREALDESNDIKPFNNLYRDLSNIFDALFKDHILSKKKTSSFKIPKGDPLFTHICPLFLPKPQEHWLTIYSFDKLKTSEHLINKKYSEAKALILGEIAKSSVDIPTIYQIDKLTYSPPYYDINESSCWIYCPDLIVVLPEKTKLTFGKCGIEEYANKFIFNPEIFGKKGNKGNED